jgi:hypothetical protein
VTFTSGRSFERRTKAGASPRDKSLRAFDFAANLDLNLNLNPAIITSASAFQAAVTRAAQAARR